MSEISLPISQTSLLATYQTVSLASKKSYYPVLTGVRALAAYMVFFTHANPFDFTGRTSLQQMLYGLFTQFHIGVSIFFVLSGFLITTRYQQDITLNWQWARRYIRNRFARIYPMYFLVTMVTFVASQLSLAYDPSRLWKFYRPLDKALVLGLNLTLLRGFFDRYRFTLAGQGWSLTVEECFYLSAPLLLLGVRLRPWRLIAYPIILVSIGLCLVMLGTSFHNQLFGFFGSLRFMLNWTFFGRCTEFVLGIGLALFLTGRPAGQEKRLASSWGLATLLGGCWIVSCIYALVYTERNAPGSATELYSYWSFLIMNLVLPVGIVIWFWGLLHEQTWLRRVLETPLADLLGKSSYVFYLIHVGVLNFFLDYQVTTNIYLKFLIINLVAIILYKYVEHPIHQLLTRKRTV